ncbi:probable ubiquitin-like-specific protease 2B [Telopea speciosissima]|uniref:probable ubiquitin-like-specific protease 2B n=1 Tax=Telopea speciosissima TaxID=54955 RepID=UPI001CC4287D|nr:probable ubiquitin-like-specific protease 2B [Telopea speciosissima]
MMGKSSREKLAVFDFNEEDELVEQASVRYIGKVRNTEDRPSAIMKYEFIRNFAGGGIETNNASYVDLDASDSKHKCKSSGLCDLSPSEGESATKEGFLGLDAVLISKSTNHEPNVHTSPDTFEPGSLFSGRNPLAMRALSPSIPPTGNKRLNCTFLDPSSDNESVGVISDDNESMKGSFPSTSSDLMENEGEPASDYCYSHWAMENANTAIAVSPDFVRYGDGYSTESLLTFSCSFIKLEVLTTCGNKESFSFEWTIDDLIGIESQWCEMAETALVKLCLKEADAVGAENAGEVPGVVELTFVVSDPQWSEKQEMIAQLHARYKAIWNFVLDAEVDDFRGRNSLSKVNYFSSSVAFEDVIYPKGDPDAVSIGKRDVELLQPETFINDTIIDFYIKYLKNKIKSEDKHRFHFFNSFFFRKLADLDKDPSSASEGREAFLRVRKWTRKVDLFEKDYIFIPVNFNLHWSLIVLCHPGEVVNFKDEDIEKSPKVPCILHMDSIKGSHKGLKNLIQSYLWEEWKEKKRESSEDVSAKFSNLRFVPLELPQQENSFDCGLFLLHYVELFLEEAPVDFSPFKITKFSHFLSMDWFPPAEPSCKRKLIKKLIYEILEEYSQKVPQPASGDKQSSSEFQQDIENENGVEILSEELSPRKICQNDSSSTVEQGIEINLLPRSPRELLQCSRDSGLIYREFFTPGATAASSPDGHYRPFDTMPSLHKLKSAMSPIEEDSETGEQFVYSSSADCQPLAGLTEEACKTSSHSSKECEPFVSLLDPKISMQLEEHMDGHTSPNPSDYGSPSSAGGADEHDPTKDVVSPNHQYSQKLSRASPQKVGCITECLASPPSGNLERQVVEDSQEVDGENLESHIVEDSPEVDRLANSNEPDDPLCSVPENATSSSHHEADITEDMDVEINDVLLSGDSISESFNEPVTKRPRLTS